MSLTDTQVERWRLLREEASADPHWLEHHRQRDTRRLVAQKELLELLKRYLDARIDTEQFRSVFDRRTRGDWDVFGLKGMSGAMLLDMFVKHVPDQRGLTERLRVVLPIPETTGQGRKKMREFQGFVEELISSGEVTKRQVQPARIPFFISAWWHLQNTERWPVFYISARKAFELQALYSPTQDAVEDYFVFRDLFLALASALGIESWELEHLCAWYSERSRRDDGPEPEPKGEEEEEEEPAAQDDNLLGGRHAHMQWLLAKIGRHFGCRIWIAANDHYKQWKGQRLGDLSLKSLPALGMDDESQRTIRLIDVLWLQGTNKVAAAFEVESTTPIYSGLLRMVDLAALSPNLNFPLYIVTPGARIGQVRRELSRPTFQTLELHKRCGFFSEEDLIDHADAIMRWANEPSAIDRLASKVGDISS